MEKYKFQAKSEDGLLEKALNELNVKEEDVITKTYEEKGGLFSGKKYTLEVVKLSDIAEVGKDVLKELLTSSSVEYKLAFIFWILLQSMISFAKSKFSISSIVAVAFILSSSIHMSSGI